jgi:two-component system phosphate regulon sensor histidine kinase PhoR
MLGIVEPLAIAVIAVASGIGLVIGLVIGRRAAAPSTPVPLVGPAAAPPPGPRLQMADRMPTPAVADVVANLPVGVIHLDDRLLVTWANPLAGQLLERTVDSLVGLTAMEAFLDRRAEAMLEAARDGTPGSTELHARQPEPRTLALRARRSASGGLWLVIEDVSELRRLQQIRAEFIDNLSHELRTPLTTLSLLAETLGRDAASVGEAIPPRMRDRIGKIEVETGHLVQMVNELLDLSRIESGPPMTLLDDVDLGRLAVSSTERLRLFAERQGVRLTVDVPAVAPHVRGDEDRLGQVLVNLLHNAVKFSPDGGDVTVRVDSTGDLARVAVEDHGIGVPAASRSRVFERFYKVDRARVRGGGTGLGLSIARHIVEGHGGQLRLESEEGRGSTFVVELPVAAPGEAALAGAASASTPAS